MDSSKEETVVMILLFMVLSIYLFEPSSIGLLSLLQYI